jgi:threonine/homoserine/homoserine lactone efflux protein
MGLVQGIDMTNVSLEFWFAVAAGVFFMQASPGPATFTVVSYTLELGRKHTAALLTAFVIGQVTSFVIGLTIVVTIVASAPDILIYIRSVGGFLLVVIGIRRCMDLLAVDDSTLPTQDTKASTHNALLLTWGITASSPLAIVFYIALLPGNINYEVNGAIILILLTLLVTFSSMLVGGFYVVVTSITKSLLMSGLSGTIINGIGNIVLIAIGLWLILDTTDLG